MINNLDDISVTYGLDIKKPEIFTRKPFQQIVKIIKDGSCKNKVEVLRKEKNPESQKWLKERFPYFSMGKFDEKIDNDHFVKTQFLIFDIDKIKTSIELNELKDEITRSKSTFFVFISPRGKGLKVCQKLTTPITDTGTYRHNYKHYQNIFEARHNCKTDNISDPRRVCFLSHDPDMFVNYECEALPVQVKPKAKKQTTPADFPKDEKVDEAINHIIENKIDITKGYDAWLDIGFAFVDHFGAVGRQRFHKVSQFHPDYTVGGCDDQYDKCLSSESPERKEKVTIKTFFHHFNKNNGKLKKESKKEDQSTPIQNFRVYTAKELENMKIPDPKWAVKNFIPEGLSILAAHPKAGKSFMALNIAFAVSSCGKVLSWFDVEDVSDCAYIGYESTLRSYQSRLKRMIEQDPEAYWPENLFLICKDFPNRLNQGIDALKRFIEDRPNLKLVVIDTLEKFVIRSGNEGYSKDTEIFNELYVLANDCNTAILGIHHTRKMDAESPFDTISGSYGITANLDAEMVLYKKNNVYNLIYRGREIEEQEYTVEFNANYFMWEIKGNSDTYAKTMQQDSIFNELKKNPYSTYKEVADELEISPTAAASRLSRMYKEDKIFKTGDKYHVSEF